MAKELPYFRFTVQEWQNGDISLERFELQGLFISVCGFYWLKDCDCTLAMLNKKYSNATSMLDELIDLGILKHEKRHDKVQIVFLNNQYDLLSEKRKRMQDAGSKGGKAKAKLKQKDGYKDKDNNKDNDNDKNEIVPKKALPEFTQCVEFWLKEFHIGWTFSPQSGKHLNSIIKKLRKILADKETESPPEKVILLFKNMCLKLPDWYKEKDLAIIDQKFNEIISEIQNGQNGISKKIGKSNIADVAKVFESIKNAPTAEEIRNRGFGN